MPAAQSVMVSYRPHLLRIGDYLVVALAIAIPLSTTATVALAVAWLIILLPAADHAQLRREAMTPLSTVALVYCALGMLGTLWCEAPWATRLGAANGFLRFACIPLLAWQFRHSARGTLVLSAFLASCIGVLIASYVVVGWPSLNVSRLQHFGVAVKGLVPQSYEFAICGLALGYLAFEAWGSQARSRAILCAILAAFFISNIFLVTTSRTTLVALLITILILAVWRFRVRGLIAGALIALILSGAVLLSPKRIYTHVTDTMSDVTAFGEGKVLSTAGIRLDWWRRSFEYITRAPIIGHGTGSIGGLFANTQDSRALVPEWTVTSNPHNQTILVALQLGLVGVVVLYAMWAIHFLFFWKRDALAALGLTVVSINFFSSFFNSFLADFEESWIYIVAVGVIAGMIKRNADRRAVRRRAP